CSTAASNAVVPSPRANRGRGAVVAADSVIGASEPVRGPWYGRRSGVAGVVAVAAVDARIASAQRRVFAAQSEVARMQRRDPSAQALANDAPGNVGDALDREPELLEDGSGGGRRAEVVEPDDR